MIIFYWLKRLFLQRCRIANCKQRWFRYPCRGCPYQQGLYWFEYGNYMLDYWFEIKRLLGIAKKDPQ